MTTQAIGRRRGAGRFRFGAGANYLKTTLLLGGLTALAVFVAGELGGTTWAIGAFVVMLVMNFVSWFYSDKIVIAMHRARPLEYREAPEVHQAVQELARRAGIPAPRIYLVPDAAPNAFATGRSPKHAVVAVTAGLLETLSPREVAAVLAHELSHVLNRDILISTVAASIAGAISLLARLAGWTLMLGRGEDRNGRNPLGALFMILVAPLVAVLIQLAVSRSREFGADATGARLSGDPEGLASALARLGELARRVPMRTADPATAHLYIVAPLAGAGVSLANLLSTHPPMQERIRRLHEMAL